MNIFFFFFVLLGGLSAFNQTNELELNRIIHRSNVGEFYEKGLEYYQLPSSQMRPIECSATLSNTGANDLTNCYLQVNVFYDGAIINSFYSDSVFIESGGQDSIFVNPIDLTGEPLGMYNFEFTIFSDSSEIDVTNNTKNFDFEITKHQLSRADFAIQDSTKQYYPDSLNLRSFGYVFKMENDACLGAILPWITNEPVNCTSGFSMNATLFELDTTLEGHFFPVQVTSNFQASCEELGTFTRVDFGAFHRELVGGKTYLITINSSSNSHNFYLSQETIDSTVFHAITDGTPGSAFIYYEPLINARMIKMDLEFESGYYCTAGLVESQLDNLEVYPNPSNGMLSIDYDFTKSTWIEIIDLNGRTLFMTQPYNTHSGNTFTINAGFLENGLYILRLSDNGKSISTKIQIL